MSDLSFSSKKIKVQKEIKKINFWTEEEDKILKEKAKEFNYKNWNSIAEFIPGKNAIQCSARYRRTRPGLNKGAWQKEEDSKLLSLYKKYGKDWAAISKEMPQRTGKQIRDRYINSLDTRYKRGKFSKEEDKIILKYHKIYGNKWSQIAKKMKTRTGDMVKNRFYSFLKKQAINNKNLLKKKRKRKSSISQCKPSQKNNKFNENNSKVKKKEEYIEIHNSHKKNKKYDKKNILNYSNEEYSEDKKDKNELNYINISNVNTKKLIVIINNYKIVLDN